MLLWFPITSLLQHYLRKSYPMVPSLLVGPVVLREIISIGLGPIDVCLVDLGKEEAATTEP
jgi:hypothetical protein